MMPRAISWTATAAALCLALTAQPRKVSDAEVMAVHRSAILIDTHNNVNGKTVDGLDIGKPGAPAETDLPRMRQGGASAFFFVIAVPSSFRKTNGTAHRALEILDSIRYDIVEKHAADFEFALTADDIEAAHRRGRIAALIGMEGGHQIENSLRILRDFHALGLRYMMLTHSFSNDWADSSGDMDRADVPHHNGLTAFGKDVVREMNRIGMMVDVSHVAEKTFWDALAVSSAPIFASHSNCRALCDTPLNLSDEMIRAMAKKGGVMQINFSCQMLSQKTADAWEGARKRGELRKGNIPAGIPLPTVADLVDHIDHVVKIAGIGAVGIGSDFDGMSCAPAEVRDVSMYPNLTRALLERGYTAQQIRQIYGGNMLRFMRQVEAVAKKNR
jgi:membrane dipeptidase